MNDCVEKKKCVKGGAIVLVLMGIGALAVLIGRAVVKGNKE